MQGRFYSYHMGEHAAKGNKFLWEKFSPLDAMLLVQKYRESSINTVYSLETYDTHWAVAGLE